MLLKCTADGRRIKVNGSPVSQGNVARGMKMTMSTTSTMSPRVHRKVMRAPHKRALAHPGKLAHMPGKLAHMGKYYKMPHYPHQTHSLRPPELCENSNDSGLGPDHDQRHNVNRLTDPVEEWDSLSKRQRLSETAVKVECDNAIDAYAYPAPAPASAPPPVEPPPPPAQLLRAGCSLSSPSLAETAGKRFHEPAYRPCGKLGSSGKLANKYAAGGKLGTGGKLAGGKLAGKLGGKYGGKLAQALARRRALAMTQSGPPGLAAPLMCRSRDGSVELQILCQPETQHRARYQTEGSRGAVKDNSGNGFPIVKLVGYDKPAVLQVYIGTDTGRVAPHMFYQACRVSGKNSTPCKERKEDGTVVIEIDLEPAKNWQATCDCVGILKERNVDVEHRFGEALGGAAGAHAARGKKKSTRCRMVFRTEILNAEGHAETLQVCSTQIICTQPPGVPEVCRKSLVSSPATGGLELYLLGKNFLKETRVVFCHRQDGCLVWEGEVTPDKEFLQQTHLVCCVPPYHRTDITETVTVQLFVRSGGKASEPHNFYYTPTAMDTGPQHCTRHHTQGSGEEARPVLVWGGSSMMPPPALPVRRPSLILPDPHSPLGLKSELADESSQSSLAEHADTSCGADGPDPPSQPLTTEDLKVVDLRLKSESMSGERQQVSFGGYPDTIKLSPQPSEPQSPLATFTQQLQAIQNQVQTDKMVETVTAAIFNSADQGGQMYVDQPMMAMDPMQRLIASKQPMSMERDLKVLDPQLMMTEATMQASVLQSPIASANEQTMMYNLMDKMQSGTTRQVESHFNHFRAITKMEMETSRMEQRLARQSAQMEALVQDAMTATGDIGSLTNDTKLDELVNSRVEDHLSAASSASSGAAHATDVLLSPNAASGPLAPAPVLPPMPSSSITPDVILNPQVSPSMLCDGGPRMVMPPPPPTQEELMMMSDSVQMSGSVKTPPAAVKSMILTAAAEILTSDSTMNALVTSAINTANILTGTESVGSGGGMQASDNSQPPAEPSSEAPMSAMSQAVSQAVTQAVSQAVTQAVSQAVSQEMTAPVQGLTDMSDSDLLSYINPSTFDQV